MWNLQIKVKGSYSGILPSLNLSTSGGKTKYPSQESIIPDLVNLEIDTIKSGESSYMSAGLSINQTLYNGGRSFYNVKQAKINLEIAKLRERNIRMRSFKMLRDLTMDCCKTNNY